VRMAVLYVLLAGGRPVLAAASEAGGAVARPAESEPQPA